MLTPEALINNITLQASDQLQHANIITVRPNRTVASTDSLFFYVTAKKPLNFPIGSYEGLLNTTYTFLEENKTQTKLIPIELVVAKQQIPKENTSHFCIISNSSVIIDCLPSG